MIGVTSNARRLRARQLSRACGRWAASHAVVATHLGLLAHGTEPQVLAVKDGLGVLTFHEPEVTE